MSTFAIDELTREDLPSADEFDGLIRFLTSATSLSDLIKALSWWLDSDVHFGVAINGQQPSLAHMDFLASCPALQSQERNPDRDDRTGVLRRLLSGELTLLLSVLRASFTIYNEVGEPKAFRGEEVVLAAGINGALMPETRVIAAEHLSYIRNRQARSASEQSVAIVHYAEACRVAHFAYNTSARARYAKYVAQNLLELAIEKDNPRFRRLAEIAWIDAYVLPFVVGLTSDGDAPFALLGWTGPIFTSRTTYVNIPPYSVDPEYVYSGGGSNFLKGIYPSFAPDFWAAAVLLIQHVKDLDDSAVLL